MRRRQLVELEDLPWFPAILRDGGTAFLDFAERASGNGRKMVAPLERLLDATGQSQLIDLCSGGGGPAVAIADELAKRGRPVQLLLTDLYPNQKSFAWAELQGRGRVRGRRAPVDATQVPPDLRGVRTLFNAFHHLPPTAARQVLADAVAQNQPIAVFEVVSRELPVLLSFLLLPVLVTLSLPLWRPFRWQWLPFTWLLPVMQFFVLWDGVVSWLRIYSVPELNELIATIDTPPGWTWEVGTQRLGPQPMHGTYLIGYPAPPG